MNVTRTESKLRAKCTQGSSGAARSDCDSNRRHPNVFPFTDRYGANARKRRQTTSADTDNIIAAASRTRAAPARAWRRD